MAEHKTPKGLVATFSDEKGSIIASVADFDLSRPGGFTILEGQRYRVKRAIAWKVVDAYTSPQFARGMDSYAREQAVDALISKHGCKVTLIPVGYESNETDTL